MKMMKMMMEEEEEMLCLCDSWLLLLAVTGQCCDWLPDLLHFDQRDVTVWSRR